MATPRQMPADIATFTGRQAEVAQLKHRRAARRPTETRPSASLRTFDTCKCARGAPPALQSNLGGSSPGRPAARLASVMSTPAGAQVLFRIKESPGIVGQRDHFVPRFCQHTSTSPGSSSYQIGNTIRARRCPPATGKRLATARGRGRSPVRPVPRPGASREAGRAVDLAAQSLTSPTTSPTGRRTRRATWPSPTRRSTGSRR